MPLLSEDPWAIPRSTERVALWLAGGWAAALALERLVLGLNEAAYLVPAMGADPREPTKALFQIDAWPLQNAVGLASLALPLVILALVAARRRRMLVPLAGLAGYVLAGLAAPRLVPLFPPEDWRFWLMPQLQQVALALGVVALAWPSRLGRGLAIAGTLCLPALFVAASWINGVFGAHPNGPFALVVGVRMGADALSAASAALLAAAILTQARAPQARHFVPPDANCS